MYCYNIDAIAHFVLFIEKMFIYWLKKDLILFQCSLREKVPELVISFRTLLLDEGTVGCEMEDC